MLFFKFLKLLFKLSIILAVPIFKLNLSLRKIPFCPFLISKLNFPHYCQHFFINRHQKFVFILHRLLITAQNV